MKFYAVNDLNSVFENNKSTRASVIGEIPEPYRKTELKGSTLFLDVKGLLTFGNFGNAAYGGTDYTQVLSELNQYQDQCTEIVFMIDSGGGEAIGIDELCAHIQSLPHNTVAFIERTAASAAYQIACACKQIIATPSAWLGCIGSVMAVNKGEKDSNSYTIFTNEKAGFKTYQGKDEQKAYWQNLANQFGERFINFVCESRGISRDSEALTGKMFLTHDALELGLIDSVMSWVDFEKVKNGNK